MFSSLHVAIEASTGSKLKCAQNKKKNERKIQNKKQIAAPPFEWRAHFVVLGECRSLGPQVPSAVTFTHSMGMGTSRRKISRRRPSTRHQKNLVHSEKCSSNN